jgi:tetratricopeptide (TPR) repeat protein
VLTAHALLYWRFATLQPKKRPAPSEIASPAPWLLYALLAAITLAAYCNCFGLGLALDAHPLLSDERIHTATGENLRLILTKHYWWPAPVERLYRPVTTLSFLFNYSILGNGTQPAGYHALNFLLHLLNVWLVFALARRLLEQPWPAFFAAALWAVHPVGTDSVANLAGRADLLAAGGLLGGLLVYDAWTRRPQPRWPLCAALAGLAAWAVFAKETGAMLLPAMLLWDLVRGFGGRGGVRRRAPAYLAVAAVLGLYLWIRMQVFAALPWPVEPFVDNPLRGAPFWVARWTAVKVIGMELWLLVCPVRLSADRAFDQIPLSGLADPGPWIALAAVAAILVIAVRLRRTDPIWFWCAGFFGLMLLPTSNLLVLIGATMAERFLYLPSVAFAIALSAACYRFVQPRYVPWVLGAVLLLFSARTLARNPDWNSDLALMSHDSATAPHSFRTRETHGEYLYDAQPEKLDAAIAEVEAAWNILSPLPPEQSAAQVPPILALLYGVKGDQAGAATPAGRAWYEKALALLQRADTISRAGEQAFEADQARHGRPLTRRWAVKDVYVFLGLTYSALGRHAEALAAYRYARGIDPLDTRAYDGGVAAAQAAGNAEDAAIIALEKALALDLQPAALPELRALYANVPGAACAFDERGALVQDCPLVHADLCRAAAELAGTFTDARLPERGDAARRYGCR